MVTKQSNTGSKQFVLLRCPCLRMFVSVEPRKGQPMRTPTAPLSRFTEAISRRICINAYRFWHRWHWTKQEQEGWGEGWGCPALPCSAPGAAGAKEEAEAPSSRAACQEVVGCPPSPNLHLVGSDKLTSLWTRANKLVGKKVEKTAEGGLQGTSAGEHLQKGQGGGEWEEAVSGERRFPSFSVSNS